MILNVEEQQRLDACFTNKQIVSADVKIRLEGDEFKFRFVGNAITQEGDIVRPLVFQGNFVIRLTVSCDDSLRDARFCTGEGGEPEPVIAGLSCPGGHEGSEFDHAEVKVGGVSVAFVKRNSMTPILHYALNFKVKRIGSDNFELAPLDPRIINR